MTTTYYLDLVMNNIYGTKTTPSIPTQYWLGLSATAPNASGTGVSEPSTSGTGYGRVLLTSLSISTNGQITNNTRIAFGLVLKDWGAPLNNYVIYDKQIGGNLLKYGNLKKTVTAVEDTLPVIEIGELSLNLKDG